MGFGYVRACAATPKVRVADVDFNKLSILRAVSEARENGAALLVLPELCLTGLYLRRPFLQRRTARRRAPRAGGDRRGRKGERPFDIRRIAAAEGRLIYNCSRRVKPR